MPSELSGEGAKKQAAEAEPAETGQGVRAGEGEMSREEGA